MNILKTIGSLFGFAALIGVVSLGTSSLEAQLTTATISGTVTDASGGVIPGASVSVLQVETGSVRTTVSDDEGRYRVPLLQPGAYEVSAELVGFQTAVRSGITLAVGGRAVIDLSLNVGAISERVIVEGEAALVETTTSAISGLVDDKKIRDLPLNGRSFEQLALLQTGVSIFHSANTDSTVGTGTKFSVAGSRPAHNNFMLDGISINDSASSTPGSASGSNLGVEGIREFKVLTSSYSAAYGRNSGATINIVTKSGTNQLHGSVFYFHRNSALDARNFFDIDPINFTERSDAAEFKRNQFGFSLGGPIVEDKTFIFGTYEGLRERLGLPNVGIVITEDARNGILPTGNVTVADSVKPFFPFIPLPNGREFPDATAEFLSSPSKRTDEDYFSVRLDHEISENHNIFGRYTFDDGEVITPDQIVLYEDVFNSRHQSFVLEERSILSPSLINTARVGFSRSFFQLDSACITQCPDTFIPGRAFGKFRFGQAQSGPAPISTIGTENPALAPYTTYQFGDDMNWTRGSHALQFGASVTRIQNNTVINGTGTNGQFVFDSVESFVTGAPDEFSADTDGSNRHRGWRQTHFGFYIQDEFNYSPALTFNLGLRWEFVTEITEAAGRTAQLVNFSDSEFTEGKPLFNFTGHQIQPRLGIAWDPFGNGKTAIRAGAGIFHNQLVAYWYNLAGANLLPFVRTASLNAPPAIPFPDAFESASAGFPFGIPNQADADVPMFIHYNLNIQHEVLPDTVLSLAYVGSRGMHLPRANDGNPVKFVICPEDPCPAGSPDGVKFWSAPFFVGPNGNGRQNGNFFLLLFTQNDVNSFYNSLQVSLNKRFSNNLQYQFSYTYAHSIDDGSQQLGSEGLNSSQNHIDVDNRKADRSHSNFDIRHNFVANATFDLPFGQGHQIGGASSGFASFLMSGWQVNGIVTVSDGSPFSPLVGSNISDNGDVIRPDRPSLVPGANNNPVLGGADQYFDPTAFELGPRGFLGNLARNSMIGPGFASVDFAVTKTTQLAGGDSPVDLQFRAEFFNIANRANFSLPDPTLYNGIGFFVPTQFATPRGRAGRIDKTVSTSRQIQVALKIIF
jgi:outer membrane receptor protein involved in Fe transport